MNYLCFILLVTILFLVYVEISVGNVIYRINSLGFKSLQLSNIVCFLIEPLYNPFLWKIQLLDINYLFFLFIMTSFYYKKNIVNYFLHF